MGGLIFVQNKSAYKSFLLFTYDYITTLVKPRGKPIIIHVQLKIKWLICQERVIGRNLEKDGHNLQTRLAWGGTNVSVTEVHL